MFAIKEQNDKYYVIPTANYLLEHLDKFTYPYDTNWEIYKLFRFPAKDFFNYIIAAFNAKVVFKDTFPFASFYFDKYTEAEKFKVEILQRIN